MKQFMWLGIVVALLVGVAGGYFWGQSAGVKKAEADIEALQTQLAEEAATKAAKAANPFQQVNPLEGVDTNPFEEAQRALNPFE